jgi:hypothetical protein
MAIRNYKGTFAPGSFEFKKVYFRDHDIDTRFKIIEINVYESIFQPCMTADITLMDANNMVANLPITEGDVVDLHFTFNSDDKIQQNIYKDGGKLKCVMEVIKISSRMKTEKQDVQIYTLHLSSPGWSSNIRTRISRGYVKKKYSDVIKEIFYDKIHMEDMLGLRGQYSEFNKKDLKNIDIEDTHGSYSIVIPRWKPIQAINWLAGRSQSGKNKNAVNYFFYEDKEQYNFKTIDSLLKQEAKDTYYVKLENIKVDDPRNYFNIFGYTYEDTGDVLLNASSGTFGSRLIVHNIVSKEVDDHFPQGTWSLNYNIHGYPANQDEFGTIGVDRFGYLPEFSKTAHTDKVPLIPEEVAETLSENPGNTRLMVHSIHRFKHNGEKTNHPEQWMRQRIMQKPQTKYIRLTLNTLGNFNRKAGDVINIELPSPEEKSQNKMDKRLKGKYLITSVRHIFKPTKYEIVMECMKDSFAS